MTRSPQMKLHVNLLKKDRPYPLSLSRTRQHASVSIQTRHHIMVTDKTTDVQQGIDEKDEDTHTHGSPSCLDTAWIARQTLRGMSPVDLLPTQFSRCHRATERLK